MDVVLPRLVSRIGPLSKCGGETCAKLIPQICHVAQVSYFSCFPISHSTESQPLSSRFKPHHTITTAQPQLVLASMTTTLWQGCGTLGEESTSTNDDGWLHYPISNPCREGNRYTTIKVPKPEGMKVVEEGRFHKSYDCSLEHAGGITDDRLLEMSMAMTIQSDNGIFVVCLCRMRGWSLRE